MRRRLERNGVFDQMNIIVDAFGGDHAPQAVIQGAAMAVQQLGVEITLVGDEQIIRKTAEEQGTSLEQIRILHTDEVFEMHEEPTSILKVHKNCSMAVGLRALRDDQGDAFVSAGSTGALVVGATFLAKRSPGIKRAALAPLLPTAKGVSMLIDCGANADCRPEMLVQFALMGSAYMKNVMGVENPAVGLVNIGSEDTKGRELEIETYHRLQEAPVNFRGNLEAREIPGGEYDVIVTDGFTGNVILKLYEGMGSFFAHKLKDVFSGVSGKLSAALVLPRIKAFKKQMDYSEVGGAVLMGIAKPVIKAHGSSDARAFYNAIRQAKACADEKMIEALTASVAALQAMEEKKIERA